MPKTTEKFRPSHELIMSGWWYYRNIWVKVKAYDPKDGSYLLAAATDWLSVEEFSTLKSSLRTPIRYQDE